ncbi:MAG: indolepyruvate ferredoxin oxidoreductase subunit alpha [Promethearchaeota archaeon]
MTKNNLDIYHELQKHLDSMPVGYPVTESGVEIKILKHLFTPEEAELAINLRYYAEPLEKIYKRVKSTGMTIEELDQQLTKMYQKGLINFGTREEENKVVKYYANAPFVIGMFEYQLNRLTPEFIKDAQKYFEEAFLEKEYNKTGIPQLRTIPIEQSIENERNVASYDDLRSIIENSDKIALAKCICRTSKDILGTPCKKTELRESCFTFNRAAESYIHRGLAREISKEKALEIFKKAEDDGLVLQPGNSQRPMCICTCCGCCCEVLSNEKKLAEPARFFATNFQAKVDEAECIGCEICLERCNLNAITMENGIAHVNELRCIGCGNCVPTCSSGAIKLYKKKEEIIPPINTKATYMAIMDKKAEIARAEKN